MKTISLTKGQYALVDDEVFDILNKHKWCALYNKKTNTYCAVRGVSRQDGTGQTLLYMHRVILSVAPRIQITHKNKNTLDNTRANLKIRKDSNDL
jgi:hypothetical protein